MKSLFCLSLVAALGLCGCQKESAPGGPGATAKPGTAGNGSETVTNKSDTFTLKVPAGNVNVQQGKEQEVTLSIDRGSEFKTKS